VFARLLIAAVLAALVVPGVAQAHHTAVPIVALDYSNRILPGSAGQSGVHATVEDAGRKLRLTVAGGHGATVLGYEGEPFLRFTSTGVQAAVHSTTARGLGLVPSASLAQIRTWTPVVRGPTFAWADARTWAPSAALHGRSTVPWSVPVVVDGRRTEIRGELTRSAKPPLWPWIVLGLLPLVAAAAAVRRRRWLWAGASGLAALAGLATLAVLGGFATGGLPVSSDRWALLAVEVAVTLVLIGLLVHRRVRLVAVAALAAFAVLQALSELAVFRHGVVVSGLPAGAVRAAAALALGAGLGAGALVFLAPASGTGRRQSRHTFSYVRTSRKEQA
jgi:hypothetical protein